jgi:hypothetical protein
MTLDPAKMDEHRREAERLALLPIEDQKAIIALHRSVADDKEVSESDRKKARERAAALTRLLRVKLN